MRLVHLLTITRVALTAAVLACAALVIDYQNPGDPAFCGVESSCMKVRRSGLGLDISEWINANVAQGLTLPTLALFLFLTVLAVTFFLKTKLHAYTLAAMSGLGAVFAGFLIYAQTSIGVYCAYCMTVDVSAIVAGISSLLLAGAVAREKGGLFSELDAPLQQATDTASTIAWGLAGVTATALPFLFAKFPTIPDNPELPPAIAALQEPGKTVVVTFTDFECPHCRKLHRDTHEAIEKSGAVVHRFMVPLAFHFGARPAAAAYLCAPPEKREKVAGELYAIDAKKLSYEGVLEILKTQDAGDAAALEACLKSEATEAKIEADSKLFDEVGAKGLPTTWVGGTQVVGSNSGTVLGLLERGGGPVSGLQLPTWLMFVAAAGAVGAVVVWTLRRPPPRNGVYLPEVSDGNGDDEDERDEEPGEAPQAKAKAKAKPKKTKRAQ